MATKIRKSHYRFGIEFTVPFTLTLHFWRWTWRFA